MSIELRREWDVRALRPGLSSVMSTRWSEEASAVATSYLRKRILGVLGELQEQKLLEVDRYPLN